jgi:hypothetical protein
MASAISTTESFQFSIVDYAIDHQGGAILDVTLDYTYKPELGSPELYFEFQQVSNYIDNFFKTYPNETDYWEVLNKNLSDQLVTDTIGKSFGFSGLDYQLRDSIDRLTTRLDVREGSGDVPYPRSTVVLNDLNEDLRERFVFTIRDYAVEHQGTASLDVTLDYQYRPGASGYSNPYFEFQQVANFVRNFFEHYPNESDPWEVVHNGLSKALTTQVVSKDFGFTGDDYFLPETIDELSTTITVEKGSGDVPYERTSSVTSRLHPGTALDGAVASVQQMHGQPLFDLRSFKTDQQLDLELEVAGELSSSLQAGLYRVSDHLGGVTDPVTGELLRPGDSGYRNAALSDANMVMELQNLQNAAKTNSNEQLMIHGGSLLAPFVINSSDQVVFAFAEANLKSDAGFLIEGLNSLLLEDSSRCYNNDCEPLQLEFNWSIA